jgi:hypothetical protein
MATDANNVLAGIGAGGAAGLSLAWFGPTSATAPTNATGPLNTFKDAGFVDTTGLTVGDAVTSNPVPAYGTLVPVRVIIQQEILTFKVTFLESSTTALEVYNRKAINSITPTSSAFTINTVSTGTRQLYSAVFDMVDGTNHIRAYVPNCEVTDKDDLTISAGQPVKYGVTLTAYPNAAGNVVQWFYVVADDIS